ncbi:hypothetical protein [Thiorhodococcus minor]|uniref:hypothetical protein n=1 Tax=Thiorhodococcus minor TaxID=57489 RepID=UPI00142F6317|nr:hypothetical protein [Thiorhodococcus minor]
MDGGSLAAAEMMVFLGLVGWLLYYQFMSSGRDSSSSSSEVKQESKADESNG